MSHGCTHIHIQWRDGVSVGVMRYERVVRGCLIFLSFSKLSRECSVCFCAHGAIEGGLVLVGKRCLSLQIREGFAAICSDRD